MNLGQGASTALSAGDFAIKKRTEQVLRHIALEGKIMLDIGCGNGLYTLRFAELSQDIIGIDIREEALREARKNNLQLHGSAKFFRASAESLPFRDCSFDVVLAIEVLEHINDQERALKEANRVLRKDGCLVLYVPNRLYPLETHTLKIGNRLIHGFYGSIPFFSWAPRFIRASVARARIYSRREIVELVGKSGFDVRQIDYMYPPLDRLSNRATKALLRRVVARFEANLLTKKFGMSILVLAQKRFGPDENP